MDVDKHITSASAVSVVKNVKTYESFSGSVIIYQLVCNDENMKGVYIGHTKIKKKVMKEHKSNCKNPNGRDYDAPLYKVIRANGIYDIYYFL